MSDLRQGRIVRVDAKVVHVDLGSEVIHASPRGSLFEDLKGRKNPLAVGDQVMVSLHGNPVAVEEILPRKNYLGRVASAHDPREQVLVANVDQLFMIASLSQPGFSSNRTDRILAACEWHEIPVVMVINKIDQSEEEELAAISATYEAIPVPVLLTCAKDGRGVDALAERMRGKVSVFYGPSGAGKSTLLNAIQPGLQIREGKVSKYWKTGRHTTSYSKLHPLDMGGYAVDTPGIRVFRLYDVKTSELRDLFPDFAPFAEKCKFKSCSHDHEPDCGVFDAVEDGKLAASRYASYVEMLDEMQPDLAPDMDEPMEGPPPGSPPPV
ncbi:MAG: ribosome biogenesis GTPase [Planctomycetota bacterium]|jgi:ribosome biogenesis GTPase